MPDNFEIAYPWVFFLVPLPLLIYFFLPALRIKSASLFLPVFNKALDYTRQKPRKSALVKRRNFLVWLGLFLCWVLLLVAISSPQLVGKPEMKVKTSRNFLIAADISFSMAQSDWTINGKKARRWDAVKQVMHEFIKKRKGDRMGLIFFASNAYIQAPFTPDLQVVDQMLEEADVGMAGQLTYIGKAITKGVEMFERDTIKTKVMLLLTDGVDAGSDILPLDAADLAKRDTVRIYTIGIGDPGKAGVDLDERTLQEIARVTNGQYFRAKDKARLEEIYTELDTLEPIEYVEEQNKPITLLYYYPLGAAIGVLLVMMVILTIVNFIKLFNQRKELYV
ncbi:VWA domain-containing protein [Galbibacter pacificus]|uniref:VWA domain-containing protein n=1 Tax=Galbibacter pacificus TaxID=2996052 RepID=A0ABT6FVB1_9FLAO|nr:VWA domain-containing protein [Galbibacter pacificus]MDG3583879.1 VWA domain-containing protein [Galbibacter pacificus]MDG3587203.1 VWA domain-containing protein [Galbibacter pacificus]